MDTPTIDGDDRVDTRGQPLRERKVTAAVEPWFRPVASLGVLVDDERSDVSVSRVVLQIRRHEYG